MDRKNLELWVTLALYISAVVSLIVVLARRLLPERSFVQRVTQTVADYLGELGDVGSGAIIFTILLVIGGTVAMALLTKGIEMYWQMVGRSAELRAEGREEGLAQGREEGRAEGREQGRAEARNELRNQLREQGIDIDNLLPSSESDSEPLDC